jgi:hypothetical protein
VHHAFLARLNVVLARLFSPPARRNLGLAGLAWALVIWTVWIAWGGIGTLAGGRLPSDLPTFVMGARIGLDHGWGQLYDPVLNRQVYEQISGPGSFEFLYHFVSPPPLAWAHVPLALIPIQAAFAVIMGISLGALVLVWALTVRGRGLVPWMLLVLGLDW